ncbi:hypothetical protein [Demequina sp. NBRC 110056]|uniref:hypothetical protein n=1 Tax=Demequina sp. NBRC 110056 TaxID=1570345 RepID=UPI0009FD699F|nr:hypothetical protein [Demequina sp. NBRC 110056]
MPLPRRRSLAAALAGTAIVLTGCSVPGQPAAAGVAAELDDVTITNEQVAELSDAWVYDIGSPANRRQVLTMELMREPLKAATDEIDLTYNRSQAQIQAEGLLELQGVSGAPSEELVDAVEGALMLAAFTVIPEDTSAIQAVAEQVEADAVTNARTGSFSADAFMASLTETAAKATAAAQQGQPAWFLEFNDVVGLVDQDASWLVSE